MKKLNLFLMRYSGIFLSHLIHFHFHYEIYKKRNPILFLFLTKGQKIITKKFQFYAQRDNDG